LDTAAAEMISIQAVNGEILSQLLPLIAAYQRFHQQEPDGERNLKFFGALIGEGKAGTQFAALDSQGTACGFATLYFQPSSLSANTACILNDLYTLPECRGRGIARQLIDHCAAYARTHHFSHLEWMTAQSNGTAQRLYDRLPADKTAWFYYALPTQP
jgi:ribosomal protein S18 acetylase RimI-like enzyme